ncbi:MAG: methylamine---glutamate N-methyltransferase subunit [Methanococcus sp.]|nr:rubredoxin [Methanococcus maripaludis]MDK2929766.1 methylamine---glutamate N-methyltransferase subunit [Methanococcus sp.]
MAKYRCNVCNVFEYDESRGDSVTNIKPGTKIKDFPNNWKCPICGSDNTHLIQIAETNISKKLKGTFECPECKSKSEIEISMPVKMDSSYLGEWKREYDDMEEHMFDIHKISVTGESVIEPMRTKKPVISWESIFIKGAQLAKFPLNNDEEVITKTIMELKQNIH